jgi:SagB-type dehydrogenase family enzyme
MNRQPSEAGGTAVPAATTIALPAPILTSDFALEAALHGRRSIRAYRDAPLTLPELAQLLWAAQGVTHPQGWRTAPSAGALYPLELYVAVGRVDGLPPAIYRYYPHDHRLAQVTAGDRRGQLSRAALEQDSVANGAVVLAATAVYARTAVRYGDRAPQYVHMEAGGAAQNVHLQAAALNLGTVIIGAFHDDEVRAVLELPAQEQPLWLMPVGRPH